MTNDVRETGKPTKCDCIDKVNRHLAAQSPKRKPFLSVVEIDDVRRVHVAVLSQNFTPLKSGLRANFCPFCGLKYP